MGGSGRTVIAMRPASEQRSEPAGSPVLSVENLSVAFGALQVVSGVSFELREGETLAIVGESGSGKSVTGLAMLGLHGAKAVVEGTIMFRQGDRTLNIAAQPEAVLREFRGREISMIFQEPMTSLNPVLRIGEQLGEVLRNHGKVSTRDARERALMMLRTVGISNPEQRLRAYPHELSGGMRQRVMIAMALMKSPRILVADEPTTALDVTIQAQILDLLRTLQQQMKMGIIFITHDLGVVAEIADQVAVMYSGRIVEQGPVETILKAPRHPYTRALMDSVPHVDADGQHVPLRSISGSIPNLARPPVGCRFHPRCPYAVVGRCDQNEPVLEAIDSRRRVRCVRWNELSLSREGI
jgi:oligopeptide/dipeptide ABC transporter ATP-binding protein